MSRKRVIVYNSALMQNIRIPRSLSQAVISNHSNTFFSFMVHLSEAQEGEDCKICNIVRSENDTSVYRPKISMHFSTFPSTLYSVTYHSKNIWRKVQVM
jgi:hypothetical protein